MGLGQSKKEKNKFDEDLKSVDLIDIIATKYILTQNFQDMKKLGQKEYCDKLVILTSDIVKKFMNEKEIEYLAQRVNRGDYYNKMVKQKVMYLDTNELDSKSRQSFSKKELEDFKKKDEDALGKHLVKEYQRRQTRSRDYDYGYDNIMRGGQKGGNILTDFLYGDKNNKEKNPYGRDERVSGDRRDPYGRDPYGRDPYRRDPYRRGASYTRNKTPVKNKKTILSQLDVRNKDEKDRMCKGIAKFYISVAHLYAAIVKTINPVYVYEDDKGKKHALSIQNRDKIPKGVTPKLTEMNLCSKRVNALKPMEVEGKIGINISKTCNLNSKKQKITMENEWRPSKWPTSENDNIRVLTRSLGQEPGIPELQQLYWDKYDYVKGKFIEKVMDSAGDSVKDYEKDLKEFYTVFTGKKDFNQWNADGKKLFTDIPLTAYHNSKLCEGEDADWKQTYKGSGGLFTSYANHVKKMIKGAQGSQDELMDILKEIFVIQKAKNDEKTEIVTLNPKLNNKTLNKIIAKTRKIIVKLYISCEKDFKDGLDIFEGILGERIIKNAVAKKDTMNKLQDKLISQPADAETSRQIKNALLDLFE